MFATIQRRTWVFAGFLVLLCTNVIFAQSQCPDIVQTALETADNVCQGMGRNQACFGNIALSATGQPDATDFQFTNVGDIVDVASIQTMQLAALDAISNEWGIVVMSLQANVPNSLPGQNVTVLIFGDTEVRNAAPSVAAQEIQSEQVTLNAERNVNLRTRPDRTSAIIETLASGSEVTATGRTEDNQWLRVQAEEQTAWIFMPVLTDTTQTDSLPIVEAGTLQYGPMQSFYLLPGIGRLDCGEIPTSGMLVQTPEGVGEINLLVNEVEVDMGSTVYFSISDERRLQITPVEGAARMRVNGITQTAVAGSRIELQVDDEFLPLDEDPELVSYADDESFLEELPLELLEREVEVEDALSDDELEILEDYEPIFDSLEVDDVDDFFELVDDADDADILEYLIDELEYTDFDDELEDYFEDELGYDFDDYDNYEGDEYDSEFDEFDDEEDFDEDFDDEEDFDEDFDDDFDDEDFDDEEDFDNEFDDEEDFDDEFDDEEDFDDEDY
ncbi:MAG: SH3 domain-containing protein [Chloroflexota bacterium]